MSLPESNTRQEAAQDKGQSTSFQLAELDAIYQTAPVGLCVLDAALRFVRINEQLAEINGLPVDEHIGRTVRQVVPELADIAEPLFQQVLQTGEPVRDVEVSGSTAADPHARRTWLEHYYPVFGEDGEVRGINVTVEEITARKQMERALRERETQLRLAMERAHLGIWINDLIAGETFWDERTREIFGIAPDEPASLEGGFGLIHPEDRSRAEAAFARAIEPTGSGLYAEEKRLLRPDGSTRWIATRGRVQFVEQGGARRAARLTGIVMDITEQKEAELLLEGQKRTLEVELAERKQAERALRESEARFRSLLAEAPVGMVTYDSQRRIHSVNRAFTRMTGYTIDEVPDMDTWLQRAYRERAQRMSETVGRLPDHDEPFEAELQVWTAWDELRTFLVSSVALGSSPGGQRLRLTSWVDITEQRRAASEREALLAELEAERSELRRREQELQTLNETLEQRVAQRAAALERSSTALEEAHNRFFTLFHASPVPTVLSVRGQGPILDVNAAALRLFGLPREAVVGQTVSGLAELADVDEVDYQHVRQLLQEAGSGAGTEVAIRDRTGAERFVLVSMETATLDGRPVAVSTLIDVTERRAAEARSRELAAELSLAQERERKRIAQILHDDVQQMLVALQIQMRMAQSGDEASMRAALREASGYVDEVLEMARSLSVELSSPALDSPRVADGFRWICNYMSERYGLQVALDVEADLLLNDPDVRPLLMRIVRELLFNAVKHAGVEQARLRAQRRGDELWVQVEDGGAGFEPSALHSRPGGTGYGLTHIAERVQLFGGRFEIEAAMGQGTRATIILPAE